MQLLDLCGEWELRPARNGSAPPVPCTVPGGVLGALAAAGEVPDPFTEEGEGAARAACAGAWELSRSFEAGEALLAHDFVDLEFDGIDALAAVTVNGRSALRADNAFRPWHADVRRLLRKGRNRIRVALRPAPPPAPARPDPHGLAAVPAAAPALPSTGIPRPVRLRAWSRARIADIGFGQKHAPSGPVALHVGGWIEMAEGADPSALSLFVRVLDPAGAAVWSGPAEIASGGDGAFHAVAQIRAPRLWWPAGLGPHPLYSVEAELRDEAGATLDRASARVGLRTLLPVPLPGGGAALSCNGRPFFLRGAVWTPPRPHPCLPLLTREDYEPWIASAQDAHFNVLRLDGRSAPEAPAFWDLCDEAGIVVAGVAPLGEAAAQGAGGADEAAAAPFYLRHACVPDAPLGEPDEDSGLEVRRTPVSLPAPETLAADVPPGARNLNGPALARRTALRGGPAALLSSLVARWPLPARPEDWLWLSQIAQAADLRERIAAARERPGAAGLLWDPFVSPRAGADAASLDAAGRWKALQYEAARAFAPEALFAHRGDDGRIGARYLNETPIARRGARFVWRLTSMDGATLDEGSSPLTVPAFGSVSLPLPDPAPFLSHYAPGGLALWLSALDAEGFVLSRDHLLFAPPKDLALQDPGLTADAAEPAEVDGETVYKVTVSAAAPAFGVFLDLPGTRALFSDGFFALDPDETLDVFVTPLEPVAPAAFADRLRVRSLFDLRA